MSSEFSSVGTSKRLVDGQAKVTGFAKYVADLDLPRMLHARFVHSVYAHAKLKSIDTDVAQSIPGVVRVLTYRDMPSMAPSSRDRLLLARDKVIFAGQPVALVLAETEGAAQDGADAMHVEYEPLVPVVSIEDALNPEKPAVWPRGVPKGADDAAAHGADVEVQESDSHGSSNVVHENTLKRGDVAEGFAASQVIAERSFFTPMVHQSSIETQGVIVQPDPMTGGATVWCSTQAVFGVRENVAEFLGVGESLVRVIGTTVGGAFGAKFGLYEPLVALAARVVNRPVRLILSRSEELKATTPAPAIQMTARLGADASGKLLAFEGDMIVDSGCYPMNLGGFIAFMAASFYPAEHISIRVREVLTNKPSTGAYRAPGAPTAALVIDTLVDEIAEKLELDPIELRKSVVAKTGDKMANGRSWPAMGSVQVLEALQSHPVWQQREALRAEGYGVGVAVGGWMGGTEPAAAVCTLNRDGIVQINVGSSDLSGTTTTFALIAAEAYGVSADQVRVVTSDSDSAPYAGGAGGSKTTYTVGNAVMAAAREARIQTLAIAAEEFEAAIEDLEIIEGEVRVKGTPTKAIKLGEIASKAMTFGGRHKPVHASGRSAVTSQSPGFSAQLAVVMVDKETGFVDLKKLVVVQDAGKAINPKVVEGQMMGGATQGIGWALHEKMQFDDQGQLLSASWMDYDIPNSLQVGEDIDATIVEVPSEFGPFGARGVGEPPVVPTAAAISNAIADAIGIRIGELPITHLRVWTALQEQS